MNLNLYMLVLRVNTILLVCAVEGNKDYTLSYIHGEIGRLLTLQVVVCVQKEPYLYIQINM